ncbi:BcABA3 [Mycena rosella]|uniref:BcABA3 n=1 Tax=Mycena rosella TaxID=1033263 RepID=A0AAD7CWW9_MYCRO|nr:BcABA3 [Mycena rosella]
MFGHKPLLKWKATTTKKAKIATAIAAAESKADTEILPCNMVDPQKPKQGTHRLKQLLTQRDTWYYPPDIADDLRDINLPGGVKAEILACAWEYARCVIPQYTNWDRYVAFMRTIVVGITAEFKGGMVDVTAGDTILGYSISGILASLFEGTSGHKDMVREYHAFLLITAEKASDRRDGELFRRYVNSLAYAPNYWFRMRDCDALARFTIAAALACNDLDDVWFSDEQFDILSEMGDTMYDAVAFYKHRSEGETNSTFAYMPDDTRIKAFRQCREVLWALDVAWARQNDMQNVTTFLRLFGGPIHLMMRRYRFVEDDLTIGRPETEHVVSQTRANFKLWNRVDANEMIDVGQESIQRYRDLLTRSDELMFDGLAEFLQTGGDGNCDTCRYRPSYGAETTHCFGGVELCDNCRAKWRDFLESFPERAAQAFPELINTYNTAITSTHGEGYK